MFVFFLDYMCKHPLTIASPKLSANTFIQGADKEKLVVPCGHCEECNHKRVNDLVFRAYHEYLDCETHKGFTLFQTLTYSEPNVPIAGGFRFFRKSDLQRFFKRLRKRLSDDGFKVDGNLKYLVTCEYGSKHFRPHYHPLFFVKFDITPELFDSYVSECWSNLDGLYTDGGKIGIVDRSSVSQRIVNSIYALQYVCKYIYKGTSVAKAVKKYAWTDFGKFVNEYCFSTCGRIMYKDLEDWQLVEIWRAWVSQHPEYDVLQLLPFYLQSKGLGMSFLETSSYDELFDVVKLPSHSPTGFVNFSLPMYYIRKVFYDYDKESKRYILNDRGKEYKKYTQNNMADSYKDLVCNNKALINDIYSRLFDSICGCRTIDDYIKYCLGDASLQNFIDYVLYLKDRRISPIHHYLLPDKASDFFNYMHDFCTIVNEDTLTQEVADMPLFVYTKYYKLTDGVSRSAVGYEPLYNSLPWFVRFDELYNVLQQIKVEFNKSHCFKLKDEYSNESYKKLALSAVQPYNAVYY